MLRDWSLGNLQDAVSLLGGVKQIQHSCTVYASTWVSRVPPLHSERSSRIHLQGAEVLMLVERGLGLAGLLLGSGPHIVTSGRDNGKEKGAVAAEGKPIQLNHLHNQMI